MHVFCGTMEIRTLIGNILVENSWVVHSVLINFICCWYGLPSGLVACSHQILNLLWQLSILESRQLCPNARQVLLGFKRFALFGKLRWCRHHSSAIVSSSCARSSCVTSAPYAVVSVVARIVRIIIWCDRLLLVQQAQCDSNMDELNEAV